MQNLKVHSAHEIVEKELIQWNFEVIFKNVVPYYYPEGIYIIYQGKIQKILLALLGIPFLFFYLSPDFHELWRSVMSICLFTEVKQQCTTLVLGWVTTSVHYLCLWWLCSRASRTKPLLAMFISRIELVSFPLFSLVSEKKYFFIKTFIYTYNIRQVNWNVFNPIFVFTFDLFSRSNLWHWTYVFIYKHKNITSTEKRTRGWTHLCQGLTPPTLLMRAMIKKPLKFFGTKLWTRSQPQLNHQFIVLLSTFLENFIKIHP